MNVHVLCQPTIFYLYTLAIMTRMFLLFGYCKTSYIMCKTTQLGYHSGVVCSEFLCTAALNLPQTNSVPCNTDCNSLFWNVTGNQVKVSHYRPEQTLWFPGS